MQLCKLGLDGVLRSLISGRRDQRVDGAYRDFRFAFPLKPQRRGVEGERQILKEQDAVALRQIDLDEAGNDRGVGVDGDGVDFRGGVNLAGHRRRQEMRRGKQKNDCRGSHRQEFGSHETVLC